MSTWCSGLCARRSALPRFPPFSHFSLLFFLDAAEGPKLRPDAAGFFQVNSLTSEKESAVSDSSKFSLGSIFKYRNGAGQRRGALLCHPNGARLPRSPDPQPHARDWEPCRWCLECPAEGGVKELCLCSEQARQKQAP